MLHLRVVLITAMLWIGLGNAQARPLALGDPVRTTLVAMARATPAEGLPAHAGLTLSRAWVKGASARVCALSRESNGDLLMRNGQLQIKRVYFRKRGHRWDVAQAEHIALQPDTSFDHACEQAPPDTVMAAAIRMLHSHPPAAGIKARKPVSTTHCNTAHAAQAIAAPPPGQGMVSSPGRSLLHTAPRLDCYMGKFIVQGDKVAVLSHLPGWTLVRYTHPITDVLTVGWLKSHRVRKSTSTASP